MSISLTYLFEQVKKKISLTDKERLNYKLMRLHHDIATGDKYDLEGSLSNHKLYLTVIVYNDDFEDYIIDPKTKIGFRTPKKWKAHEFSRWFKEHGVKNVIWSAGLPTGHGDLPDGEYNVKHWLQWFDIVA